MNKKKSNKKRWIALTVVVVLMVLFTIAIKVTFDAISDFEVFKQIDSTFADQHLKTSVALVELHKLREGEYPKSLKEIKYTGSWDGIALGSVKYVCAEDGKSYYMEASVGHPMLSNTPEAIIPDEFWNGLGYNVELKNLVEPVAGGDATR